MGAIGIHHYLYLSAILFFIGAFGVLFRRNLLVILIGVIRLTLGGGIL